jgi:DNA polymerase III sliding clamp (beta) subunit (PCNA family)
MLKVNVTKENLEKALQITSVGVSTSAKDLSAHFLFRLSEDGVQVLTNNQRVCASVSMDCDHDGEVGDALTIIAKALQDWMRGVSSETDIAIARKGGEATAKWVKNEGTFLTLETAAFAYWDETLSKCQVVAKMDAERLQFILDYIKQFVFDKETTRPDITQVELQKGALWATDKRAVTIVTVPELESASLRIHGKDIPLLQRFLSLKETEEVEILEGKTMSFFRRQDGAVFGVAKPEMGFPELPVETDGKDDTEWEIRTEELTSAIYCLSATAMEGDDLIRFRFDDSQSKVVCSVRAEAGKDDGREDMYLLEPIDHSGTEKLPKNGFEVSHQYLTSIMGHFADETLKFGITGKPQRKGGYVRFFHEKGDDSFLTVVVWRII